MAQKAIKHFSIYVQNAKAVTFNEANFDIDPGAQAKVLPDGTVVWTIGVLQSKISAKGPVLSAGFRGGAGGGSDGVALLSSLVKQQLIEVCGVVGGVFLRFSARITKGSFDSKMEGGDANETFEFSAGAPDIL